MFALRIVDIDKKKLTLAKNEINIYVCILKIKNNLFGLGCECEIQLFSIKNIKSQSKFIRKIKSKDSYVMAIRKLQNKNQIISVN